MANKILQLLNEERYMGNTHWTALHQWITPTGEMGIYQTLDTEIGKENVYLIIWTMIKEINQKQVFIKQYGSMSLNVAVIDARNIARFANAVEEK